MSLEISTHYNLCCKHLQHLKSLSLPSLIIIIYYYHHYHCDRTPYIRVILLAVFEVCYTVCLTVGSVPYSRPLGISHLI